MLSDISWGQFLSFILLAVVGYCAVVYFMFYRNRQFGDSDNVIGKTTPRQPQGQSHNGSSLMGSVREGRVEPVLSLPTTVAPSEPVVCEACGHVHGTAVASPVAAPEEEDPTGADQEDFEPVDGAIDIEAMIEASEQLQEVTVEITADLSEEEAATKKASALSLFAQDDLLNSELSTKMALALDQNIPSASFSAVEELSTLQAA